ncbi:unnamed protein product [Linum trigynum]|uniref:Uncharacterized protein n=1 Tax=Linum trigynum TaxID=586398 RepID=A0AAV2E795_9ROSI
MSKRCHYEVLGISLDASPDDIRSSYKKLALQRHPDKLMRSGLSEGDATAQFQELVHAYEVLSDPKERAWYDSHRSQILFSDPDSVNSGVPDLFSFFSNTVFSGYSDKGKGFYKVYSDVFNKIYANEVSFCKKLGIGFETLREAPLMGNLESPYRQVTAFYSYWLGFSSVLDFCWADQYDVMAGPDRRSRRLMEEENKKLRKKAKRDFNETVRGLADFVKKRDKRVIDMMVKKNAEMERKKEEEKERKKKLEREKMERMRAYEEPDWAKVSVELDDLEDIEDEKKEDEGKQELYCVACGKKFKSDKQWKNHEQSKKHKEKVAELRESFKEEEEKAKADEEEDFVEFGEETNEETYYGLDEVEESFEKGFTVSEDNNVVENLEAEDGFVDTEDSNGVDGANQNTEGAVLGSDDDDDDDDGERNVLEAMLSGRRNRKTRSSSVYEDVWKEAYGNGANEGRTDVTEHDSRKGRRKAKKEKGKSNSAVGPQNAVVDESKSMNEEKAVGDDDQMNEPCCTTSVADDNANDIIKEDHLVKNRKSSTSQSAAEKKGVARKETNSKTTSKGKKGKGGSKKAGNSCEACGEEFESRNKLHKHLGETGHGSLKYR